jgi:hypothetical protein
LRCLGKDSIAIIIGIVLQDHIIRKNSTDDLIVLIKDVLLREDK